MSFNKLRLFSVFRLIVLGVALAALSGLGTKSCQAAMLSYNLDLNTSSLDAGNYGFYFSLSNGQILNDNSTVLSGFSGSSVTPTAPILLADSDGANSSDQSVSFTSGGTVHFNLSSNYTIDSPPDQFYFSLFNLATPDANVSTTDPFTDRAALFVLDYSGSAPTIYNLSAAGGSPALTVSDVTATPEPSTWAMMAIGLGLMSFVLHRKKSTPCDKEMSDLLSL